MHLVQAPGRDVVDEAAHGHIPEQQRRGADDLDIVAHALLEVAEGEERDLGVDTKVVAQRLAQLLIGEREHAAVGVVDHDHLTRTEQLLRDDQRADGVGGAPACVADHMCVAFAQPEEPCGVQARVHAGHHRDLLRRWHRQVTLVKASRVALIGP
jgi:hypothetical protein